MEEELQARQKFVNAFNKTMIQIWQEQITLLDVIDTGRLLKSVVAYPVKADGRFYEISLSQAFLEYGIWQDYGTGKEIARGNPGDIGRAGKVRKQRRWFSPKYYSSVMNLRDFLAESIGQEFVGVVTNALDDRLRQSIRESENHRKQSHYF
ncbi:MAG: hypothetical protein IKR05_08405 [Prevotella sp.]|nr:hypothetical protein [Prevotella sp.]